MNGINYFLIFAVAMELIWILSSAMRKKEEDADRPRPQPDRIERPRQRTSPTNVDRFLEEINRRRKEATARQYPQAGEPPRSRPVSPVDEAPRRRVEQVASAPRPATARPRPRIQADFQRLGEVELVAQAVEVRPTDKPVPVVAATVVPAPRPSAATDFVPTGMAVRRMSPQLATLLPLLRSKQAMPLAVILNEIFGPPLCRRPRHARPGKRQIGPGPT